MSGIYGFSYLNETAIHFQSAMDGLAYWNRIFGTESSSQQLMNHSGIGCHIEHFSNIFPYGGPILDCHGRPAVVDALLYNRDELIPALGLSNGSSLSDEELLLLLIEQKGFDALASVNGDFAGAIYDTADGSWTLFRDHFGVRPLYIYRDDSCFAFSTDIRGALSLPNADTSIDEVELYARISGQNFLSQQRTAFARVRCALPAAVTTVTLNEHGFDISARPYWSIRTQKVRFRTEEEYRSKLYELIEDAVNRRCDAIPGLLGAELSGGLDSGVIDILINRHGRDCRYFSWSDSPDVRPLRDGDDERKIVLDICEQEQITCRFLNREDRMAYRHNAERLLPPFVDTNTISMGSSWLKSQGANVVFSGHAGDEGVSHRASRYELFYNGEYLSFFKLYWREAKGERFRFLRAMKRMFSDIRANSKASRASYKMIHYPVLDEQIYKRAAETFKNPEKFFNYAPHEYVMLGGSRYRLENAAYQGAANGVRYLFPYVDYRVFDYALSIPRRLFIKHNQNRVIFREAFRHIMPPSLYEVNYKDSASRRDLRKQTEESNKDPFRDTVQLFLDRVDQERWAGILDFNALEELAQMDKRDPRRKQVSGMFPGELIRCLAIQNIQENVSKWRDFDEPDKTV